MQTSMPPDTLAQETDASRARQLAARGNSAKAARKVAQEFEAMFVGMMLKSMRDTVGKDKLTGGGKGEEMFQSMLDQEYATAIATSQGGIGLAAMIEKQLVREPAPRSEKAPITVLKGKENK
ncbi:rod-binding protein [Geobacter hydrogenophilus]|uniref:Flagellar rod-binding protein FlgJ n=1 Tax=Geobacter hydrogenophilus TaxID=40983 RepID=A0A9W6LD75_9BACT|nr:rod-binding protein [Geobacter hydrogenophilus]MBT0894240.1 rod-binding protein [Geobacter hydrogenophilus]GLI38474.1 flagellar rod-binding protein FlgJ [Geobacter hydrogenophilus]